MLKSEPYTIEISQANFDGEQLYQATVKEFPDIAEYAETYEEAHALILDAIATTEEILAERRTSMRESL
jgi:predicted RNase H-like HicB family nuclease